jgi:hypothetical protein
VAYHVSPRFYQEVVALFGDHFRRLHPKIPRLHVNFPGEFQTKVFDLGVYPELSAIPD